MTRIGRWSPCTTSRPFAFSSSRLPASANSLFGASMSIPPAVPCGNVGTPSHRQHRHPVAQTRKAAGDAAVANKLTREQIAEAQKLARECQLMARAQLGGGTSQPNFFFGRVSRLDGGGGDWQR